MVWRALSYKQREKRKDFQIVQMILFFTESFALYNILNLGFYENTWNFLWSPVFMCMF